MSKKTPCISILIACYNTSLEKVKRCVDSLVSQVSPIENPNKTYSPKLQSIKSNIEIIFVDDGSTIPYKKWLLSQYGRAVKYVRHFRNKGLVEARRTGFKHSCGKYILFIDSDDKLPNPNVVKTYFEIAEKEQADIVHGEAFIETKNMSQSKQFVKLSKNSHCYKNKIASKDLLQLVLPSSQITLFVWGKCFSRSVLEKTFKKIPKLYCVMSEEFLLITLILYYANSYIPTNEKLYTYYFEDGISVTKANLKATVSMAKVCPCLVDFFKEENITGELAKHTNISIQEIIKSLITIDNYFLRVAISSLIPHLDISENPKAWDTICASWGTEKAYKILENLNALQDTKANQDMEKAQNLEV